MGNDIIIEGIKGTIAFVGDPETKLDSQGKPYTKQAFRLTSSDGGDIWCDILFGCVDLDRAHRDKKVMICSTVKDGKMQGIKTNKYKDKPMRLTLSSGVNLTFPEGAPAASEPTQQSQPTTQSRPQQYRQASSAPVNGLHQLAALWTECYNAALPVCGEAYAVQAAATLFIEANKRNIGPTLTQPHAAIAALAPSARKIADEVIAKGGYDADKLPDGDELDAVVDLLIDKAAESISRERLGVAYDTFVAGYPQGKQAAVKAMVSSWEAFLGGVK